MAGNFSTFTVKNDLTPQDNSVYKVKILGVATHPRYPHQHNHNQTNINKINGKHLKMIGENEKEKAITHIETTNMTFYS